MDAPDSISPSPLLSEERFRMLVEAVQDYAIFMLDPQGYVESWNVGAQKIKGYAAHEIIGKHFSVCSPPPSPKCWVTILAAPKAVPTNPRFWTPPCNAQGATLNEPD